MAYATETIKQLRELTGAGIVDVKQALDATDGDLTKATEYLRKQGKKVAMKKAERTTREGVIGSYVHANGKVAALVALACETDFVARNKDFQDLAHDIALHIAAASPEYRSREDVPEDVLAKEREIIGEQLAQEKKPAAVVEKIVEGKLAKYFEEHCLLQQPFVKDDSVTVGELVEAAIAKIGENIEIRDFVRFIL